MVGFTGLQTKTTTKEILLTSWLVKKEIASGNSLDSQAQFEDLRLKYCIQEENAQNTLSGSNASLSVFTHAVKKSSSYGI